MASSPTVVTSSRTDNDASTAFSPVRIFPSQHFQRSVTRIRIPVDHPHRCLLRHFLVHKHLFNTAEAFTVFCYPVSCINFRIILRIEGDDRQFLAIPRIREGPVYLNIRLRQSLQPPGRILYSRAGLRRSLSPDIICYHIPQRNAGQRRSLGLRDPIIPYSRSRSSEQVIHHILLIIAVLNRRGHSSEHFAHLVRTQRKVGQNLRHLGKRNGGMVRSMLIDIVIQYFTRSSQQARKT